VSFIILQHIYIIVSQHIYIITSQTDMMNNRYKINDNRHESLINSSSL